MICVQEYDLTKNETLMHPAVCIIFQLTDANKNLPKLGKQEGRITQSSIHERN